MATVGKLFLAVIVLLVCFYSTTTAMTYLYGLGAALMAF